jgi:D-3-phosphoglycerate dehydrogenase / 2-oxoglutarate reductase
MPHRVLLTDYAWPDVELERRGLAEAGAELVVAEATDAETLKRLAAGCDAIMTNWAKVPEAVIAAVPNCRIVSRLGIGLDNIDVAYCTRRGIPVTNVPDYCVIEVAEHALALLLGLSRKIGWYHHQTMQGEYKLQSGPVLRRIEGQTLGIVGLGNIGIRLAEKAVALGMKVVATSRSGRNSTHGVRLVDLDELLAVSDYVSLHVPLVPETRHLMNAARLARMKPTAYLINTARGGLIDHAALAQALAAGRLAGAGLDVQDPEPPGLSQAPYSDPRVIVTPHAAFVSEESLENLRTRVAKQVATRLLGGVPENVVNPQVLQ